MMMQVQAGFLARSTIGGHKTDFRNERGLFTFAVIVGFADRVFNQLGVVLIPSCGCSIILRMRSQAGSLAGLILGGIVFNYFWLDYLLLCIEQGLFTFVVIMGFADRVFSQVVVVLVFRCDCTIVVRLLAQAGPLVGSSFGGASSYYFWLGCRLM